MIMKPKNQKVECKLRYVVLFAIKHKIFLTSFDAQLNYTNMC
jgi:hypothetical protein